MNGDLAQLGLDIRSDDAVVATKNLDGMTAASERADKGAERVRKSSRRAGQAMDGFGRQANKSSRVLGGATNSLRNVGLQLNQVAQQGAITGNFLQAFAFQLPDILLGFGTMGVLIGVVAGAMTPFVTGLLSSTKAGERMEDQLDAMSDALRAFESASDNATQSTDDLLRAFGSANADRAQQIFDIRRQLAYIESMKAATDVTDEFQQTFGELNFESFAEGARDAQGLVDELSRVTGAVNGINPGAVDDIAERLGVGKIEAQLLAEQLEKLGDAKGPDAQAAAVRDIIEQLELATGGVEKMDEETRRFYASLLVSEEALLRLSAIDAATGISDAADEAERLARNLQTAFETQSFYLRQRFAGEEEVFSQEVAPVGQGSVSDEQVRRTRERIDQLLNPGRSKRGGSKSAANTAKREAERIFESTRTDAEKYAAELKKIDTLHKQGLINDDTRRRAIKALGAEYGKTGTAGEKAALSISDAWSDFIDRGLTDFRSFARSIGDTFKRLIADMVLTAARNKILIGLGFGGGAAGAATSAIAGAGPLGGLGGLASNVLGGGGLLGGVLGSFGTGSVFTGLTGGSGFLGGIGSTLSGVLSGGGLGSLFSIGGNAAAVGGGIGALAGAALPVLGLGFALFGLFKKKPIISQADFKAIQVGLSLTGIELFETGKAGQRAAKSLRDIAGGVDEFEKKTQSYFDLFFSENEKREKAEQGLADTFASLGITAPKTKNEFRSLVESLDLMSLEGRKTYNTLLDIAPIFSQLSDEAQNLDQALSRLTGSQGLFASLQDQVFVASQLAQGNSTGMDSATAKLDRVIEAIRAGNIVIAKNTKIAADVLERQELEPAT